MNKPKFKSVKFLPFDLWMTLYECAGKWYWENGCAITDQTEYLRFYELTIEQHPELFEVEKAEREFEEGAYYKARYRDQSLPEAIKYIFGKFFRTSDVMGSHRHYAETDFHEISEKIEL